MYRSLLVIDDFYDHPDKVRAAALGCDYPEVTEERRFPGRNSAQRLDPPGLTAIVSQLVGEALDPAPKEAAHGHFRITQAGEESRYDVHADPNHFWWVGVIYLTLPEHCQGGTSFYRHLELQSDRNALDNETLAARCGVASNSELLERDGRDPSKWERIMAVPMRFNRLILYRPWVWHSAEPGFGDSPQTARLIQLLAFCRPSSPASGSGAAD